MPNTSHKHRSELDIETGAAHVSTPEEPVLITSQVLPNLVGRPSLAAVQAPSNTSEGVEAPGCSWSQLLRSLWNGIAKSVKTAVNRRRRIVDCRFLELS